MNYLPELFTVAIIHALAVMSPGPDFIMITRSSLIYSRRTGIFSALGIGAGNSVHVAYSLLGIGFIISQSIFLFNAIKLMGAAYLIFIGYKSLRAQPTLFKTEAENRYADISAWQAFRLGFWTNVMNPKAALFFFSLFTLIISPGTPLFVKIIYGAETSLAAFLWFATVATILSHHWIKNRISRIQHWAERVMGVILIALGIKLIFTNSK